MTTNLGDQAQTRILTADLQVLSPTFSQSFRASGSATSPIIGYATTIQYVAGYNKYICYFPLASGGGIGYTRQVAVRGVPADFSANYSVMSSSVCVASTSFDTAPQMRNITNFQIDPNSATTNNRYIVVNILTNVLPVFSTGTAYMKIVLQFSLDN